MTPKDAFNQTVHSYPGGCAALATRLDMSASLLRNKACPTNTSNVINLDDADRVMALTGDFSVLHALAKNHGFVCTQLETVPGGDMAVLESVTDIWEKMGALGKEVHKALEDGRIEQHEVVAIEAAAFTTFRPIMQLLERLRGMAEQ